MAQRVQCRSAGCAGLARYRLMSNRGRPAVRKRILNERATGTMIGIFFSIIRQTPHDTPCDPCATQVYDSMQEIPYR